MVQSRSGYPYPDQVALIDNLGGPKAVSEIIIQRSGRNITGQAISMWKQRGIPYNYRVLLMREAAGRGLEIPKNFLDFYGAKA